MMGENEAKTASESPLALQQLLRRSQKPESDHV
jgi:hypothetical protein